MKAIILAAGEGSRLRPLTDNIPKCMIEFLGKPLLEWQIGTMRSCGISDIVVVTGYKSEFINFPNIKYYKNEKFDVTNMVETLFCAEEELSESVIVSYGDIIFQKEVLELLIKNQNDIGVIVDKKWRKIWETRFNDPLSDAESLRVDQDGNLSSIGQKVSNIEEIQGQYIGLMKFQNQGIDNIKKIYHKSKEISKNNTNPLNPNIPFTKSYMTDFLQGIIKEGIKMKPVYIENGWLEIDSVNDFKIYNKKFKEGTLDELISMEKL